MRALYVSVLTVIMLFTFVACMDGQTIAWEDSFNLSGRIDRTFVVAATADRALTVGISGTASGLDLVARTFDATGTIVWYDQVTLGDVLVTPVVATQADGLLFSAGHTLNNTGTDMIVVAHDIATGNRVWINVVDKGIDDFPQSIATGPNGVYVVGYGGNTTGSPLDFLVEAYDKQTGALLWEDRFNNGGDEAAFRVFALGSMVLAAGTMDGTVVLRAYNALSGTLLWEATKPVSQSPTAIAANVFQVYIAGNGYLNAYSLATGALAWQKDLGNVFDLEATPFGVFAAGDVVGFHSLGGGTVWQSNPAEETIKAMALSDGVLYVTGAKSAGFDASQMLVRAYNAIHGAVLWEDFSHTSATTEGNDIAVGTQVIAVGWATTTSGDEDAITRAYYPTPSHRWKVHRKISDAFSARRTVQVQDITSRTASRQRMSIEH